MSGSVCGGTPFSLDEQYGLGIERSCRCGTCWWSGVLGMWFVPNNWGRLHPNKLPRGLRCWRCPECGDDVSEIRESGDGK